MLPGKATVEDTAAYAKKFPAIEFRSLGAADWRVSPAGFGAYRVSDDIPEHKGAMVKALCSGVNLVDTSTNYTDGGSERLVGEVLHSVCRRPGMGRGQMVVVTKVGYLQGRNFALSQQRKREGRAFPDLVPYGEGLEHCIHPEFIDDQLSRSLDRLQLETIDVLLLHNPEYYLGWAARQGMALPQARKAFYHRIALAFEYLETQIEAGRIQAYGISANTFPTPASDEQFVSLERVWQAARGLSGVHHFQVVQMPMNLLEPGAALEGNQSGGATVLEGARSKGLGVLINRPLNAIVQNRLIRLAEVERIAPHSDDEIIRSISALNASEKALWRKVLAELDLPAPLYRRIKDQAAVGDALKHYWRNFGSYDRWRQFIDGFLWPHLTGVFEFLQPHAQDSELVAQWLERHRKCLTTAVRAVGSLYVSEAAARVRRIKAAVRNAHPLWDVDIPLQQLALQSLRTTRGISAVLVGMRSQDYVDDVLQALQRKAEELPHGEPWHRLADGLEDFMETGQAPGAT